VKESRAQSATMLEALERLQQEVRGLSGAEPTARGITTNGTGPAGTGEVVLVATERGTMAHRPSCTVVSGKDDLRTVTPADGLAPCKLCEPYDSGGRTRAGRALGPRGGLGVRWLPPHGPPDLSRPLPQPLERSDAPQDRHRAHEL